MNFNWDAIGAIASAVASIAALITIILTIKNTNDNDDEKQFSVQPWFHVTSMARMGGNAPIVLHVLNDGASTIRIDKINLLINNNELKLDFKYLKKDDRFTVTGKVFEIQIINDDVFFGESATIAIYFTNLYNKHMKAVSPGFEFVEKKDGALLGIKNDKFLYIPFKNELIK